MNKILAATLVLASAVAAQPASAVTVTLNLVASYARNGPFGLAYDGSKVWWSQNNGAINEMTTAGVDTGNQITGTTWSALAYNPANHKIATVNGGGIYSYDRPTTGTVAASALNPTFQAIAGGPYFLTDGLDIHGSTLWWSPDVSTVYASALDGSGSASTFLSGSYSGVQYVSTSSHDFLVVVNDGSSPRNLCVHNTDASLVGCTILANSRYEDLAYDGRYLYAADYYGNKIDKIDLQVDGKSIGGTPEPDTWALMIVGFGLVGVATRRRQVALTA